MDKKPTQTNYKIALLSEYDDWIFYRATCSCLNPDHSIDMVLEYDFELNIVTLSLNKNLYYCAHFGIYYGDKLYWIKNIWNRIKGAVKLLLTGYIEVSEEFLFTEKKQLDAFIAALQEGRAKLEATHPNN